MGVEVTDVLRLIPDAPINFAKLTEGFRMLLHRLRTPVKQIKSHTYGLSLYVHKHLSRLYKTKLLNLRLFYQD